MTPDVAALIVGLPFLLGVCVGLWVATKRDRIVLYDSRAAIPTHLPKDCGITWVPVCPMIGCTLGDSFYEVKQ